MEQTMSKVDNKITKVDPQYVSDMLGSLDARMHKTMEDLKALTELVAKMHVDLYTHVNESSDPVDYDDSLIK
jgi:hypothetical protein